MPISVTEPADGSARLEGILEEAAKILEAVASLCLEQRHALLASDTQRLEELNERAETLAARFRLLDSARRELEGKAAPRHDAGGDARAGLEVRSNAHGAPGAHDASEKHERHDAHETHALGEARRRLSEAAAAAALAASGNADLLARCSAATTALRRVVEGAASAGYLPNGEHRPGAHSLILEKRA